MRPIFWKNGKVILIDQKKLPEKLVYIECKDYNDILNAINNMNIRGAPALGIASAFGIALAARKSLKENKKIFLEKIKGVIDKFRKSRPTAVNLFWALERQEKIINKYQKNNIKIIADKLLDEAIKIQEEDIKLCKMIGKNGRELIKDGDGILTHCNAGALATGDYGTALGVIRAAFYKGTNFKVYVDETRPYLQGARLTAWELKREKIPFTLICDNMAGYLMKLGKITKVIVGADRIAINYDVANKIGTYSIAVLAKHHKIPFYVAAPYSTFDRKVKTGNDIKIEFRDKSEVTIISGVKIAPANIEVFNPAFDITPSNLITGIITETGIIYP